MNKEIQSDIYRCARCGENHLGLVFIKFINNPVNEFTHWALCPITGEPILMVVIDINRDL